jgi:uncharacterized protein (DUF2147 family)
MKKLIVLAALIMATTSAHAGNGISFEIEGQKIHIEAPRNCDSLSCIKISAPGFKGFKSNHADDDDDTASNSPPAKSAPAPAPVQATAPQPVAPAAGIAAPAQTTVATAAPVANDIAPSASTPAAIAVPAPQPAPVAAAPAPAPTTPLGVWATEENKGNVRIEECGANLCGYAEKSGEKILINMKPEGSKWSGRIHDPDSGRNYDSTIALKGTNSLKVQGCAFGGMFCGGQTWKRVS